MFLFNKLFFNHIAGAFKIMPCSPKDAKSMNTTADSNANASDNSDKRNEGIPSSTVFNFNTVPSVDSMFHSLPLCRFRIDCLNQ